MSDVQPDANEGSADSPVTRRRFVTLASGALGAVAIGQSRARAQTPPVEDPPESGPEDVSSEESNPATKALLELAEALNDPSGVRLSALAALDGLFLYRYEKVDIPFQKAADLLPTGPAYELKEYAEGYVTIDLWSGITMLLGDDLTSKDSIVTPKELVLGPTTLIPSEALPPDFADLNLVSVYRPGSEGWNWRTWALGYSDADYTTLRGFGYFSIEM